MKTLEEKKVKSYIGCWIARINLHRFIYDTKGSLTEGKREDIKRLVCDYFKIDQEQVKEEEISNLGHTFRNLEISEVKDGHVSFRCECFSGISPSHDIVYLN